MLYNSTIAYNQPGANYLGSLIINIASMPLPIIIHNINIVFGGTADYSNKTTIAVISVDIAPSGLISIETVKENLAALTSIQTLTLYEDNVIGIN